MFNDFDFCLRVFDCKENNGKCKQDLLKYDYMKLY